MNPATCKTSDLRCVGVDVRLLFIVPDRVGIFVFFVENRKILELYIALLDLGRDIIIVFVHVFVLGSSAAFWRKKSG